MVLFQQSDDFRGFLILFSLFCCIPPQLLILLCQTLRSQNSQPYHIVWTSRASGMANWERDLHRPWHQRNSILSGLRAWLMPNSTAQSADFASIAVAWQVTICRTSINLGYSAANPLCQLSHCSRPLVTFSFSLTLLMEPFSRTCIPALEKLQTSLW